MQTPGMNLPCCVEQAREDHIDTLYRIIVDEQRPFYVRRAAFEQMKNLIAQRTPAWVATMEHEQGLGPMRYQGESNEMV